MTTETEQAEAALRSLRRGAKLSTSLERVPIRYALAAELDNNWPPFRAALDPAPICAKIRGNGIA
jgi:hypothetical protein